MTALSPLGAGLLAALCGAAGAGIGLAREIVLLRRQVAAKDASGLRWHRRHGEVCEELEALRAQVAELGYVILDGRRRWGFDLATRWPDVAELVGELDPMTASRFLVEWAPGIGGLRESGRATDRVA